jgi:hypothetical protein
MKRACRIQIYVWAVFSFFNFNKQNVDFANLLGIYLSSVLFSSKTNVGRAVARHHELSGSSWCWETVVLGLGVGTMNCLAVHGAKKQLG